MPAATPPFLNLRSEPIFPLGILSVMRSEAAMAGTASHPKLDRDIVIDSPATSVGRPLCGRVHVAALIAVVLVGASPGLARASDWEVIAEGDGIVVSRRLVEGRDFPQLRSVGEVPGTPYEVLAILLDVPAQVDWRPDCVESKTVRKIDTWRSIVYTRTDAPWPVSDREVVVENEVIFTDPPSKVKVTFAAVTAPDVERRRGTVRMKMATGFYAIEAIDDARSLVHYEVDADPGGSLPDWLVSMQSTRNPLETLAGLRKRLEETRGQYGAQIARFPLTPPEAAAAPWWPVADAPRGRTRSEVSTPNRCHAPG